jgi:4-amino-4-deoxy-L-arabinose transferase-like glycosyltransferase
VEICDLKLGTIKRHWAIALILTAFIALGITYSLVTPIFESPDEIYHYFFIKHLTDGKGLPVQNPEDPGLWEQEGSQPPLYYLMGALTTFWSDTSDAEDLLWCNPQANIGTPLDPGNKNVIVHTQREGFPFRGAVLAIHLVRLLSVLLGAGTVFLTYKLALEVFPDHEHLALGAAAINAFIPQFLFISGSVNNDNLVAFLSSLALLLLIRNTQYGIRGLFVLRIAYCVLLGLVLGLACLSKLSGLGLSILTAIVLIVEACRRRSTRPLVGGMMALAVALAVAGWWYVRNWTLYGDPTGLNMMLAVVGRGSPPSNLSELWGEFRGLRISFWALFGWFSILVAPAAYAILDAVSLLALVGLSVWSVRRRWLSETRFFASFVPKTHTFAGTPDAPGSTVEREKPGFSTSLGVLILWLAIVFLGLVRWTWTTPGTQGRLLFPAISALCILLMLGLSQLVPVRYTKISVSVIGVAMFVFAALCPFLYIGPAYARPPVLSPAEVPTGVVHDFGGKIRLLGYQLDREEACTERSRSIRPGETLGITFYWQSLVEMKENYHLFIHLLGRRGQLVGHEDTYHGWGSYPTSLWRPGEIIGDTYRLPISEDALAPSLILVDVGLYDPTTGSKLKPQSVVIGRLKMVPKGRQEYAIDNQSYFNLDNKAALIGYEVDKAELGPGEEIRLTLYWRAEGEMGIDYTVFTHLIDEEGRIWGQMDSQPLEGDYPTSFWDVGEVIEDEYVLAINEDAPAGLYRLEVGMYELATGQRLPVLGDDGEVQDNRILLPLNWEIGKLGNW